MVVGFGIKVKGMENATAFIRAKGVEALKRAEKGVAESALFLRAEVVESIGGRRAEPASVDTGRFKNSVQDESNGLKGRVFSDLEYAKFLEFGTSKIQARHHFRNSMKRNEKKIQDFIQAEVNKI